jgi:putative flippase GtrA
VRKRFKKLLPEASKYSTVGAMGYVVDVSLFNLFSVVGKTVFEVDQPFGAKIAATAIAVFFTYVLNSRWTFKHRNGRPESLSRIVRYALVNVVGLSITILALFVSRNILGFDSLLADNISANVVGVGLAMIFRFFANRKWVFIERP